MNECEVGEKVASKNVLCHVNNQAIFLKLINVRLVVYCTDFT